MSNPSLSVDVPPAAPAPDARWGGWPEVRSDLRSSVRVALALALAGVPAGFLWWLLAPRADFEITEAGPEILGNPSAELLVADDAVLALVLLGVGLIAGVATWFLHRRRGVGAVFALAIGASAAAVIAWQVGGLLAPGPTEAQLTEVGGRVTTALRLGSAAVLAVAPFAALFGYLAGVLFAKDDGLGRSELSSPSSASGTDAAAPAPHRASATA